MSKSGIRQLGISEARANMTEVIAEVRLLGKPVVLTRRDKPQAALVSVGFYEQALRDRALIELLQQRAAEGQAGDTASARLKGEDLYVALARAERDIAES